MKQKIISFQPTLFECFDIYSGTVTLCGSKGFSVHLDCGAYGYVRAENVDVGMYANNDHLKFMVIGFQYGGLLDLIPTDVSIPPSSAIVRTVTSKGLLLELLDRQNMPLVTFCPPKGLDERCAALKPGQKVQCAVWETSNGRFVSHITSVNRENGNVRDFYPEIVDIAVAKGSLLKRNGIELGKTYAVQKQPTKALLNGEYLSLEIPKEIKPGEFATLEAIITYIPSSKYKHISAKVVSVLKQNQVTI